MHSFSLILFIIYRSIERDNSKDSHLSSGRESAVATPGKQSKSTTLSTRKLRAIKCRFCHKLSNFFIFNFLRSIVFLMTLSIFRSLEEYQMHLSLFFLALFALQTRYFVVNIEIIRYEHIA